MASDPTGGDAALTELLPRSGGEVAHAGDGHTPPIAGDGQPWDAVLQPTSAW